MFTTYHGRIPLACSITYHLVPATPVSPENWLVGIVHGPSEQTLKFGGLKLYAHKTVNAEDTVFWSESSPTKSLSAQVRPRPGSLCSEWHTSRPSFTERILNSWWQKISKPDSLSEVAYPDRTFHLPFEEKVRGALNHPVEAEWYTQARNEVVFNFLKALIVNIAYFPLKVGAHRH